MFPPEFPEGPGSNIYPAFAGFNGNQREIGKKE
jgi:hypothetical protein